MYKTASAARGINDDQSAFPQGKEITCDWHSLRKQLLLQWNRLTVSDLGGIGPNRRKIAGLVQRKYGISADLIEHYLLNLERTLPAIG